MGEGEWQGEGLGDSRPGQDVLSRIPALPSPVALTKLPSSTRLRKPQFTPLSALQHEQLWCQCEIG